FLKKIIGADFFLYGTDLDRQALAHFKNGIYRSNSFRDDGSYFHYLLDRYGEKKGAEWHLSQELQDKIQINPLNLYKDDFSIIPNDIALVFFRNTLIYMNDSEKKFVLSKVREKMIPNGFLFLSCTETHMLNHTNLKLKEYKDIYFFQKIVDTPMINPPKLEVIENEDLDWEIDLEDYENQEDELEKLHQQALKENQEINIFTILDIANGKKKEITDKNNDIAQQLVKITEYINDSDFVEALALIDSLDQNFPAKDISCYLKATICYQEGDALNAIRNYNRSLYHNQDFWLAHFYLGKIFFLLKPGKALRELERCQAILKVKKPESPDYHFLIEGFSEKYFLAMCEKMLKELKNKLI
ncbi:MAG: hypothetical protein MJB14_03370, partial [Spirochaetes bacterium]|nr:hypothetical protein [Spirochaetota bacterium]